MAKLIQLILTEERTGKGIEDDPVRLKSQLWTPDGLLVAEEDPCKMKNFFNSRNLNVTREQVKF